MYICVCDPRKSLNGTLVVDSPFHSQWTSHRIYRLAILLCAQEMLSSLVTVFSRSQKIGQENPLSEQLIFELPLWLKKIRIM